jgi:hypothetical protein
VVYERLREVAAAKGGAFACPRSHAKVTDGQDHFPLDTIGRARNALARVAQYDAKPVWWSGSLPELVAHVKRMVKRAYPSIAVTE